jgi:mono/diheme cytochrome c family protein
MKQLLVIFSSLVAALLILVACQGTPTQRPPIDLNPDMDDQPKYLPQAKSEFFADSATMRMPVAGTVARGELRADDAYYRGMDADGNPVKRSPVPVTLKELERGQERFNIYCSPCHSRVGDGKGIMVQHGYVPPPSFHQDRIRDFPDGHIFDVITHGIRNMPSYAHQIPVADRWAIIAYVRALQRSQNASLNDVPVELRNKVQRGSSD